MAGGEKRNALRIEAVVDIGDALTAGKSGLNGLVRCAGVGAGVPAPVTAMAPV